MNTHPQQHRRSRVSCPLVALALAAVLVAPATAAERTHDIVPEDYFSLQFIYDCALSPDGKYVAFTNLVWGERDESRRFDLWQVDTESKRLTRLTFADVSDTSPTWSPDSRRIYFQSRRDRGEDKPPYDGTTQVWMITPQGGQEFPVTRVKDGIHAYELSRDGGRIYYSRIGEEAFDEWKTLRKRYPDIKYGSGPVKYSELWVLDLETWREKKLASAERVIKSFAVTPDGSRIAMITTPDDRLITNEGQSRVDVLDVASGNITTLPDRLFRDAAPSPYGWLDNLAWSTDGDFLAWTVDFDGYPSEIFVADMQTDDTEVRKLRRPDEVSVAGRLHWVPGEDTLCFLADHQALKQVYAIEKVARPAETSGRRVTAGEGVIHAYSLSADGQSLAIARSDTENCRDLYLTRTRGNAAAERLTRLNPHVDTWKLPQIRRVTWKAPDGTEVEGILELPPDWAEGDDPLPMIVELHGGPTACTYYHMRFWIYGRTLFATKGYALLSPNYRGSTGYGDEFLRQLIGREADIEVKDILAGVDALVHRGIADPDRLGVMGWSNGGFLTNALITQTRRFKAASSGAGVVDQLMQWGLEDTPGHVINYMEGLPWDEQDAYIKASAAYQLDNVTTPTLIHVGENDHRVPAEHSRMLYRGLKEYLEVPTVLLIYPGAGHGLTVYDHRLAKMQWDVAWFDKYILGREADDE